MPSIKRIIKNKTPKANLSESFTPITSPIVEDLTLVPLPPQPPLFYDGYVWSYKICPWTGTNKNHNNKYFKGIGTHIFFWATLSSSPNELQNKKEFVIPRDLLTEDVDQLEEKKYWAITFSAMSMAVIAVLKDALISGNKVRIHVSPTVNISEIAQIDLEGPLARGEIKPAGIISVSYPVILSVTVIK